ncbi:hypothetical protein ACOJBO_10455 [Rhizobium beringeri]
MIVCRLRRSAAKRGSAILLNICNTLPFVTVDDTGARHANRNFHTTQIGGEHFTAFRATPSKSRLPATLARAPAYREERHVTMRCAYAFCGCSLQM